MKEKLSASLEALMKKDPREVAKLSTNWFKKNVNLLSAKTNALKFLGDHLSTQIKSGIVPGSMIFFTYSAIHKETLEYWDSCPIGLVLSVTDDGQYFYSLNLHYVPVAVRIKLLDRLIKISDNKTLTTKNKLQFTWETIKSFSNIKPAQACIKMYKFDHVMSRFAVIPHDEYYYAAALPLARFKGASEEKIWMDSMARF